MKNIRLILLTILLTGLAALPAAAADYYVDIIAGDNANTGLAPGSGGAWETLHWAAGYTGYIDGDGIHVAAGEYSPDNGEPDSPLEFSLPAGASIVGAGAGATIITSFNSAAWGAGLALLSCNGVTVRDLTVTNVLGDGLFLDDCTSVALTDLVSSYSGEGDGIFINNGSGNMVSNCAVHNANIGVEVYMSSGNTITNCDVHNNGSDGIYVYYGADNTVTLCSVFNNFSYGILYNECGNSLAVSAITRNRVYNNPDGIGVLGANLFTAPDVFNNLVYVDSGAMDRGIVISAEFGSTGSVSP